MVLADPNRLEFREVESLVDTKQLAIYSSGLASSQLSLLQSAPSPKCTLRSIELPKFNSTTQGQNCTSAPKTLPRLIHDPGNLSFPRNTTCPTSLAKNGGRRGVGGGFFFFISRVWFCRESSVSEGGCRSAGMDSGLWRCAGWDSDGDVDGPVIGTGTSTCSDNRVGGAGIRRQVLQDVHVYVTACPCEGNAETTECEIESRDKL